MRRRALSPNGRQRAPVYSPISRLIVIREHAMLVTITLDAVSLLDSLFLRRVTVLDGDLSTRYRPH